MSPFRSFVLAARVTNQIPHALFWDAAGPYHYLRTHTIGDQTWLIAGGKDKKTAHGEEPASMEALRQYVGDRFQVIETGWEWAAGMNVEAEIAQLARGEGRVVGRGPSKLASYRNSDGLVSRFSAVCPHMKCIVRWNEAQASFDCPCHGSRFACDGSVIEGPALEGLSKIGME